MELRTGLEIDQFLTKVESALQRLLMLDYDGTIAPFREQRDQAYPYPDIAAAIQEIVRRGRTRVVIVSGRDVNELRSRLGIQPIPELRGDYGMQRRRPNGVVETARVDPSFAAALSDADRWLGYQQLRKIAEIKIGGIAAHWRGLPDKTRKEICARVRLGWEPIAERSGLQLFEFDGGLEIRVPKPDKGDVVRMLLAEEGRKAAAAYLGDDTSDESAFRAIGDRGLSILVRDQWRETAARLWLKPPGEVRDLLTKWLAVCRKGDSTGEAPAMAVNV